MNKIIITACELVGLDDRLYKMRSKQSSLWDKHALPNIFSNTPEVKWFYMFRVLEPSVCLEYISILVTAGNKPDHDRT